MVPILFNVKGYDLFHIDRWSKKWDAGKHPSRRGAPSGLDAPSPFSGATFYAPQQPRSTLSTETGRAFGPVSPYSYSLSDVIERGLFAYLFAEEDVHDATFGTLVLHLEEVPLRRALAGRGRRAPSLREECELLLQTFDFADLLVHRPTDSRGDDSKRDHR